MRLSPFSVMGSVDKVNESSDGLDRDSDFVAFLERERIRRHDADARHEVAAMRKTVFAKQPIGEGGEWAFDLAYCSLT